MRHEKPQGTSIDIGPPPKRIAYTIKIDPDIRKHIQDWAYDHEVPISSVIESLARNFLSELKPEDVFW